MCEVALQTWADSASGVGPFGAGEHHDVALRLAALSLATDPEEARGLLDRAYSACGSMGALTECILEPTARELGDRWANDDCGEYDVTMALCRLQSFVRELSAGRAQHFIAHPLVILVAPMPGEVHLLGASLDAEALWEAGHDIRIGFPDTELALQRLVAATWFDAIDLTLSLAFRREHRLSRMEQMIATVRRTSKNPALLVVVGGRVFHDRAVAGDEVGADGCAASACHVAAEFARVQTRLDFASRLLGTRLPAGSARPRLSAGTRDFDRSSAAR